MATQTEDQKLVFKTDYSAILSTFIKQTLVFKTFVLSIFEWPLKTGFTVHNILQTSSFQCMYVRSLLCSYEHIHTSWGSCNSLIMTLYRHFNALFDLILYATVNNFSVLSGQVPSGLNQY